jgi:hypothetical protein
MIIGSSYFKQYSKINLGVNFILYFFNFNIFVSSNFIEGPCFAAFLRLTISLKLHKDINLVDL